MKFVIGKADEIPTGSRKIVRVAGRSIRVFNVDGRYYAIRNRCPHQGAPLCEGKLWGSLKSEVPGSFEYSGTKEIIACIQHGWEFSLRTGQSWCEPKRLRVRSYQVDVEASEAVGQNTGVATWDIVKNPTIVTVNPRPADPTSLLGTRADRTGQPDPELEEDPDAPAPGMVKGPFAVETYEVAIEEGYLYLVVDVVDVMATS